MMLLVIVACSSPEESLLLMTMTLHPRQGEAELAWAASPKVLPLMVPLKLPLEGDPRKIEIGVTPVCAGSTHAVATFVSAYVMLPAPVEAMTKCWPLSISEPALNVVLIVAPVEESDCTAGPKLRAMVVVCTEAVMLAAP